MAFVRATHVAMGDAVVSTLIIAPCVMRRGAAAHARRTIQCGSRAASKRREFRSSAPVAARCETSPLLASLYNGLGREDGTRNAHHQVMTCLILADDTARSKRKL